MRIYAISSTIKGKNLQDALLDYEAAVIEPAYSIEEIKLAAYLAEKSFKGKRNIAKKKKYEFLLWLSGKTDLKSAFRITNPKGDRMALVVFSGSKRGILEKLEAENIKMSLQEKADPLDIERISLSRIKN